MKLNKIALTDSEMNEIFPETESNELLTIVETQDQNFQGDSDPILIGNLSDHIATLDSDLQIVQIFHRTGFDDLVSDQIEMLKNKI